MSIMLESNSPSFSEDGWDGEEQSNDVAQAAIERLFREMPSRAKENHPVIDLSEDEVDKVDEMELKNEEMMEPDIIRVIEFIDLVETKAPRRSRKVVNPSKRNPSVALDSLWPGTYSYDGMELKRGVTVEILPLVELFQASFLLIQQIITTSQGITLRGLPLTRTRNLRGQLPRLRNEVALILEIDMDDTRPEEEQAAIEIPVTSVIKPRICHITNKNFPEHRYPHGVYRSTQDVQENALLVCRWKVKHIWKDTAKRVNKKAPMEFVVARITRDEVPKERFRISGTCLMNTWRGGKICGGSFVPDEPGNPQLTVNLDTVEDQDSLLQRAWIPKKHGQQYTLADMFCGAGGVSCGAKSAGFRVELACDNADGACNTYRVHFPEADLRKEHMYDFILSMRGSSRRVDVLHLSPPCQFWSPAHTTVGVNDEANIAILFACHELVKGLRPRIFTLEQTFGIMHPRFEFYFNSLIHGFTQYNYSVRWGIVNLLAWGAASQRRRLIVIGSGPGEELPPFPVATHSQDIETGDGTRPYRTVRKILRKIPPNRVNDPLHRPNMMNRINNPRWDPNIPLLRTITCGGGIGNYHYSGKRPFTLRELAMLQGFPLEYQFQTPEQKRQIGNAFPPLVVATLYKHIRRWLEEKDHIRAGEDELSESESDDKEYDSEFESFAFGYAGFDDNDDVEYLGRREIYRSNSEVEFLGKRNLNRKGSVMMITDSESEEDGMQVDAMSEDVNSPDICIDAIQSIGNDPARPINLD
ncbi:hypothetical protein M426DRAFT_26533 [Hypoxylon sp. CI-4A]|nr:hypothetical protein M426DRAFT_26533 [Hypoxylon sp. CI-4A]